MQRSKARFSLMIVAFLIDQRLVNNILPIAASLHGSVQQQRHARFQ